MTSNNTFLDELRSAFQDNNLQDNDTHQIKNNYIDNSLDNIIQNMIKKHVEAQLSQHIVAMQQQLTYEIDQKIKQILRDAFRP